MKKFLIGLLAGFILAGIAAVVTVLALARASDRKPSIADGSTLILKLHGEIVEVAPMQIPLPFFESRSPMTMVEVWDVLRKAEVDSRIKAIGLEPQGIGAGWAKLDEIHAGLKRFKRSGKPVIAFLRNPGAREYYLATAADKVLMTSEDFLNLKGLRAEVSYYRKGLDKLGIQFEAEHAGKYKDAADMFTRSEMSPETREVINSILDQLYGHLIDTIAKSRKKTPEQIRATIDQGPFLAHQAKSFGLIDGLAFENEYLDELKSRVKNGDLKRVSARDYARVPASSVGLEGKSSIAFIAGQGAILRGGSVSGFGDDTDAIYSAPFIRLLRQAADDTKIRGVILRVDSPGGDAIASDEILHEVKRLSKKKPLVVSMSDVAASGGYYISMSGDPVLAYPNTITGSIGVIFGKVNLQDLYGKLGINVELITRGRYAAIDSSAKPMTAEERAKLREGIEHIYQSFLERVADGRNRKVEEIKPLAQGRVWMGTQAKHNGLLDEMGGLDRAIELVKTRAKIPANEKVQLVMYPPKRSILEQLFGTSPEVILEARARRELRRLAPNWDVRMLDPGGMLRVAPFSLDIR